MSGDTINHLLLNCSIARELWTMILSLFWGSNKSYLRCNRAVRLLTRLVWMTSECRDLEGNSSMSQVVHLAREHNKI